VHPRCRKPHGLDGLISIFAYQGLCKRVIGKLKYRLVTQAFPEVIEAVVSLGDLSQFSGADWLIVPIPLHASRQRWRGFNQADYMGQALANYLHIAITTTLLTRHKRTKPQMSLHAKDRRNNIKDAFSLNPMLSKLALDAFKHNAIVLVDDVYTTGATMKEAAKTLKRNGFTSVWGLTLARTVNPGE
jgi:ComF family protein